MDEQQPLTIGEETDLVELRREYDLYCQHVKDVRPPVAFDLYVWHAARLEVQAKNHWWAGRAYQRIRDEYIFRGV